MPTASRWNKGSGAPLNPLAVRRRVPHIPGGTQAGEGLLNVVLATDMNDGVTVNRYYAASLSDTLEAVPDRIPFQSMRKFFSDCFLPEGYPSSVSKVPTGLIDVSFA